MHNAMQALKFIFLWGDAHDKIIRQNVHFLDATRRCACFAFFLPSSCRRLKQNFVAFEPLLEGIVISFCIPVKGEYRWNNDVKPSVNQTSQSYLKIEADLDWVVVMQSNKKRNTRQQTESPSCSHFICLVATNKVYSRGEF